MFNLLGSNHINDVWTSDPYDIYKDKEGNTLIEFALVGLNENDISVSVSGQTLKVDASAKNEEANDAEFYHKKISRRSIKKSFTLHQNIDKESITAEYKNGLLRIKVPLAKEEKTEIKIKIK